MPDASRVDRDHLRQYRRVTVMGLGLFGGGAGAARYFARLGADVTVTDMADAARLAPSVALLDGLGIRFRLGGHDEEDFGGADLVVANQAVRPENRFLRIARDAGVSVVTETGLALALNRSPWVGVTGSSGKSTTSALLAAMLAAANPDTLFGGNIGGDLMTRVEDRDPAAPLVVELSSYQLTYIADDFAAGRVAPPRVAVVTNISPNHLDWHRDMDEYVAAKFALVDCQGPGDWTVLNVGDPRLRDLAAAVRSRVIRCAPTDPGSDNACRVDGDAVRLRIEGEDVAVLPLERFRLIGPHNVQNALEAVAAAYVMCNDAGAVCTGFASFGGLPHRLEMVGEAAGRVFVNDSKATTPEAACLALASIGRPTVLIAGGYDKKSPFDELGAAVQERAVGLVLLGASAGRIRAAVDGAAGSRPAGLAPLAVVECGDDFARAVEAAWRLAPEGGAVLLSPACASWGMFTNYEERGRVFGDIAARLCQSC